MLVIELRRIIFGVIQRIVVLELKTNSNKVLTDHYGVIYACTLFIRIKIKLIVSISKSLSMILGTHDGLYHEKYMNHDIVECVR